MQLIVAVCFGAHAVNLFVLAPRHLRLLGLEEASIGAVQGAFPLASLSAMLVLPRILARFGRRRTLTCGMALCALGALGFGVAQHLPFLVLARAVQGAGWAAVLVSSAVITAEIAPVGRLGEALGVSGILTLLAMAMGPLLGEILVAWGERAGHEPVFLSLFLASASFAVVGGALGSRLPEPAERPRAALGAVPFRPAWALLAAFFGAAMGFGALVGFLADYTHLVGVRSMSPFFQANVGMAIATRLAFGSLSDRIGRQAVIAPALIVQGIALGGLAWLKGSGWLLWPLGLLFGVAQGLYYPALQALIVERAPAEVRPRAIASSNFAFASGMAASAFLNGAFASRAGYPAVYLEVGLAAWASVALVLWERRRWAMFQPAP